MSSHPCSESHRKRLSLSKGELKRLSAPKGQDDWNLAGGSDAIVARTRGGNGIRKSIVAIDESDEDTVVTVPENTVTEEEEVTEEEAVVEAPASSKKTKPIFKRVVLEVDQIDNVKPLLHLLAVNVVIQ
jgi:hypothetical protein